MFDERAISALLRASPLPIVGGWRTIYVSLTTGHLLRTVQTATVNLSVCTLTDHDLK